MGEWHWWDGIWPPEIPMNSMQWRSKLVGSPQLPTDFRPFTGLISPLYLEPCGFVSPAGHYPGMERYPLQPWRRYVNAISLAWRSTKNLSKSGKMWRNCYPAIIFQPIFRHLCFRWCNQNGGDWRFGWRSGVFVWSSKFLKHYLEPTKKKNIEKYSDMTGWGLCLQRDLDVLFISIYCDVHDVEYIIYFQCLCMSLYRSS